MKRYNCTSSDKRGAFGLCMEEHEQGAFVPFSEISGLAEQLADATRQCGVMADLLREVTKIVPAIGVAIDDLPVVDVFLERVEMVLAGQVLEPVRNEALAMMMDELHDICVGLDAPGGAQNGAEAWEQVKAAKEAYNKARIAQLKEGGYIQFQRGEGWVGKCICCERLTPIYCNVAEFDPNSHYCGGSPSCCP
ncbi:hypothetical protein ACK37G_15245 [Aeromonas veronii]